jgi:hypothetical protein
MKTLICTIIVGEKRAYQAERLAESVKEFYPEFDTVIYHDKATPINHDTTIEINDLFKVPYKISGMFNYSLKGMVVKDAYDRFPEYERIIFLDADIIFWRRTKLFEHMILKDLYATIRWFNPIHEKAASGRKYHRLAHFLEGSIDLKFPGIPYVTETIIVMLRNERITRFIDLWAWICETSSINHVNPSFEAVEIGIALHNTPEVEWHNICGSPFKKNDCLRTEHRTEFQPVIAR